MRKLLLLFAGMLILSGCGSPPPASSRSPKVTEHEVTGAQADRVKAVTAIVGKRVTPPSAIVDARFVEEQTGDNQLGPADFRGFGLIEVAPAEVGPWETLLTPLPKTPDYQTPTTPRPWWVSPADFGALKFYAPDALTTRHEGWIGISAATGKIYIFTFTT